MAKILLVEDDNNLREIYEARLMAEGYDIVSARDGEEALTVAIKEKPDLVISDVMMPKISGFDMLDILRTTEETKHVKVIMMTALSQAEDKARAEKLGADRYLVKSQVTLEDVAKVAKEVLDSLTAPTATPVAVTPTTVAPVAVPAPVEPPAITIPEPVTTPEPAAPTATSAPAPEPAAVPEPVATPAPAATPVVEPITAPAPEPEEEPEEPVEPTPAASTMDSEEQAIAKQLENIISQSVAGAGASAPAEPPTVPAPEPVTAPAEPAVVAEPAPAAEPAKAQRRVIEPLNDVRADMSPKLQELAAKEAENEAQATQAPAPTPAPVPTIEPSAVVPTPELELPKPAPAPEEEKVDPNSIAL